MVGITLILVLLFVWKVSMLREFHGNGNAGVGAEGCVVSVSARCEV